MITVSHPRVGTDQAVALLSRSPPAPRKYLPSRLALVKRERARPLKSSRISHQVEGAKESAYNPEQNIAIGNANIHKIRGLKLPHLAVNDDCDDGLPRITHRTMTEVI